MKVEVTQEDINRGMPKVCDRCPIALAMRRAGCAFVYVEPHRVDWRRRGILSGKYSSLPSEATRFIMAFDNAEPVQPFTFEVPE